MTKRFDDPMPGLHLVLNPDFKDTEGHTWPWSTCKKCAQERTRDDAVIEQLRKDSLPKGALTNMHWWVMAKRAQGANPDVEHPPVSQEEARHQCLAWVKKMNGPKLVPEPPNTHTEIIQGQEVEIEDVDMHREVLEKNLFLSPEELKEYRANRPQKIAERRALNKRTKGFKDFLDDV